MLSAKTFFQQKVLISDFFAIFAVSITIFDEFAFFIFKL